MKIAKLELKIIVSIFVVGYEYDVVDLKGRLVERLPSPDYNQQQQVCVTYACNPDIHDAHADRTCFFPSNFHPSRWRLGETEGRAVSPQVQACCRVGRYSWFLEKSRSDCHSFCGVPMYFGR
jgi:hypothetical protein